MPTKRSTAAIRRLQLDWASLYTSSQVQDGEPRKGQIPERGVIEVKGLAEQTWQTADSAQASKYFGRVLGRLTELAQTIAERGMDSTEPIPIESAPTEAHPLVAAMNVLIDRSQHALDLQRRFVADAAHELRTPLSALARAGLGVLPPSDCGVRGCPYLRQGSLMLAEIVTARQLVRTNENPARCQRMTVSGLTITKAFTTPGAIL
jgi:hypothetical protein